MIHNIDIICTKMPKMVRWKKHSVTPWIQNTNVEIVKCGDAFILHFNTFHLHTSQAWHLHAVTLFFKSRVHVPIQSIEWLFVSIGLVLGVHVAHAEYFHVCLCHRMPCLESSCFPYRVLLRLFVSISLVIESSYSPYIILWCLSVSFGLGLREAHIEYYHICLCLLA